MNPSIIDPMSPAWSRMVNSLFRPLNLGKWFCMGFAAWLMTLAESTANASSYVSELPLSSFLDWISCENPAAVAGWIGGLSFLLLVLMIVCVWLSARGRFIFLYQLIHDSTDIQKPWAEFREVAHSFFFWSLGLSLAILIAMMVPAGGAVFFFSPFFQGGSVAPSAQVLGAACILLTLLLIIPALYAWFYLAEFIAPIMFRYRCRTGDAWRFFGPAWKDHTASMLLYPLFRSLLSIGIMLSILIIGVLTCCLGFILMAIPYIGAVITLPITFFLTGYSLEYLKSLGPDYDAFIPPADPAASAEAGLEAC